MTLERITVRPLRHSAFVIRTPVAFDPSRLKNRPRCERVVLCILVPWFEPVWFERPCFEPPSFEPLCDSLLVRRDSNAGG
jgi:hypothetical protein